jgi:chloramphenicol 3-O-phosphotransferase
MTIFLITGASASGKSTVAQLLAEGFDRGVHVKGDVFRRMVVSGREEMSMAPSEEAVDQLRLRYKLGATTADVYATAGFTVVVQDVIIGHHLRDYVDRIRNRPLNVVVLAPRADVLAAREAARQKTAYRGIDTPAAMDAALREETPRIGLWLDTSEQTPEQTVAEILRRRDEALL